MTRDSMPVDTDAMSSGDENVLATECKTSGVQSGSDIQRQSKDSHRTQCHDNQQSNTLFLFFELKEKKEIGLSPWEHEYTNIWFLFNFPVLS